MHAFSILCLLALTASAASQPPDDWRQQKRLIDLHQHISYTTQHLARAVKIMDAAGLGIGVNLSGGTTIRGTNDAPSEFERNKALADRLHPGRFLHYMNLDYKGWNQPDFSARAVKQIEEGHRLGAAGLKEYKRLGLYLRDGEGKLIRIDDPKLDPVWKRCGELKMPVSIHVADPRAFWLPYDSSNERWTELKDHRPWWFGDTNIYPPRMELLEALNRVIERNPNTTFVCVHFANNAEELDWVERSLDRYPNMNADLAARIPEIGRHPPDKVRRLFVKHQDRIFFATDFQVYNRLTLGSGGSGPAPTDAEAETFYAKHWRWLETNDRDFDHMTPIQGDWKISGIGLPPEVLRKIYFDNARRLLGRSLPAPAATALRIDTDFAEAQIDGDLSEPAWQRAETVPLEYESRSYTARPKISTTVRLLWSGEWLYLGYESPYTKLTIFEPPQEKERLGLWDRDVVEVFIGSDTNNIKRYTEFEVAPTNEKLDLILDLPERDFAWSSGFQSKTKISPGRWTCEMRIPIKALAESKPAPGTVWRINLYRCDRANNAFLAWSPTMTGSFHAPEKFGWLKFVE